MADNFLGSFEDNADELRKTLELKTIMHHAGAMGQSALAGVVGLPGDMVNLISGVRADQPSKTTLPTYTDAGQWLGERTGVQTPVLAGQRPLSAGSEAPFAGPPALKMAAQVPALVGALLRGQRPPRTQQSALRYLQAGSEQIPGFGPLSPDM